MRTRQGISVAAGIAAIVVLLAWQPAYAGEDAGRSDVDRVHTSSKECQKFEFNDGYGPTWVADRDYGSVLIKAGRERFTWQDVDRGDRLTVPNDKDISHVIVCSEPNPTTSTTKPTTDTSMPPKDRDRPQPKPTEPTTVPTTTATSVPTTTTPPPTSTPTVPPVPTTISAPPTTIGSPTTSPPTSAPPPTVDTPVTTVVVEGSAPPPEGRDVLPFTGLDTAVAAAIGAGMLAAGGAAVLTDRKRAGR